ncbi:MAG: glycosyltransferase family 2 protein [Calditrichaeota bacterium]|nr:glycosyltransferase family 2 protein [Calditrichota bacterium]
MTIKYDIVIPAFNAQKTLPVVLNEIQKLSIKPDTVFVVDDGSKDQTGAEAQRFSNVKVMRLTKNQGKGLALRAGIQQFLKKNGTDFLLLMDADGQHPVTSIPEFLQKAALQRADILIGHRRRRLGEMPLLRIFSNTVSSLITSWVTGKKINDSQCGFRLLRRSVLETLTLEEDGFQIETELIIKAVKQGFILDFVPIPTIYNGQKSYIKHFSDTVRFVRIVLKELTSR